MSIDVRATFKVLSLMTAVLSAAATAPAADETGQPASVLPHLNQLTPVKTDLFAAGEDGYATYRIPGIVVTGRGTILAYCAARKDGIGDWADIDIALRRSTDEGRSWQPRQILVDADKATADNPTAIVDRKTGAIHFLYQVNYARCFYMRSDDDGQTFSPAVDITSVSRLRPAKTKDARGMCPGSSSRELAATRIWPRRRMGQSTASTNAAAWEHKCSTHST